MIERVVVALVVFVVFFAVLAAELPRVSPSFLALGVLVLVGRVVWFYTR